MNIPVCHEKPFNRSSRIMAIICILGPGIATLMPMAPSPALPAMAQYFSSEGDSQLFAQMVMTAPAIMVIIFAPLSGLLAEKIGDVACLFGSLILYTVAGAAALFIDSTQLLIASRLLLGIAGAGILTTTLALLGKYFDGEAREQLLGYAIGVSSAFASAALIFGGAMVDLWGWRAPFSLYLLGIVMIVFTAQALNHSVEPLEMHKLEKGQISQTIPLWPFYLLLIILIIGMYSPSIQGPFALESRGIDSAATRGMIIGATSIVAAFAAISYGFVRRYLSAYAVLAVDALCLGSGLLIFALADNPIHMAIGCGIVGIGAGWTEPATASIILGRLPVYIHPLAMGLVVSALYAGQFVNPVTMHPLREAFDINGSLIVLGLALCVVAAYVALRNIHRLTNSQPVITNAEK